MTTIRIAKLRWIMASDIRSLKRTPIHAPTIGPTIRGGEAKEIPEAGCDVPDSAYDSYAQHYG